MLSMGSISPFESVFSPIEVPSRTKFMLLDFVLPKLDYSEGEDNKDKGKFF